MTPTNHHHNSSSTSPEPTAPSNGPLLPVLPQDLANLIQLQGSSWTDCGYCKGSRGYLARRNLSRSETSYNPNEGQPGSEVAVNGDAHAENLESSKRAAQVDPSIDQDNHDDSPTQALLPSSSFLPSSSPSSKSYNMTARNLQPALYEQMLETGWRRCGVSLYKPDNAASCCPALTIRLLADHFAPTKSQRKIMRRAQSFFPSHHDIESSSSNHHTTMNQSTAVASTPSLPVMNGPSLKGDRPRKAPSAHQKLPNSSTQEKGEPRKPARKRGRMAASSDTVKAIPTVVETSLVWKEFQDRMVEILREIIPPLLYHHQHDAEPNQDDHWNEKMSLAFKCWKPPGGALHTSSTRRRPPQPNPPIISDSLAPEFGTTNTQPEDDEATEKSITLYTSICAALAGRSKGALDREVLAEQLVQAMRRYSTASPDATVCSNMLEGTSSSMSQEYQQQLMGMERSPKKPRPDISPSPSWSPLVRIQKISCHGPSGQVFVQIAYRSNSKGQSFDTSSHHEDSRAVDKDMGVWPDLDTTATPANPLTPEDRFLAWWNQTYPDRRPPAPPLSMQVTTVPAHQSALDPQVHQLYFDYQHQVHGDPHPCHDDSEASDSSTRNNNNNNNGGDHLDWGNAAPEGWRRKARAMISQQYRHLSKSRLQSVFRAFGLFYEFLVENPFPQEEPRRHRKKQSTTNPNTKVLPPGTYHQHYRISGDELVAVGVVDILPKGLSSVYMFYHPSFARELLPLGKYAILREIAWTQEANLPFYYLGYYIESCPKMRYKADYSPSQLLCPTTYHWVDAEEAKQIIQRDSPIRNYCTLYQNGTARVSLDEQSVDHTELAQIPLEAGIGVQLSLSMLTEEGQDRVRPWLEEFSSQAGMEIARQCVIDFR